MSDRRFPTPPLLQDLWRQFAFKPNPSQRAAILHGSGPLFLPAGPGSGKTRVLLWRAVHLIAVLGVAPEEIFLATFTEKAALQLRDGLRTLLGAASARTGRPYDPARLYVGTVHSLCHRLLLDRRLSHHRRRTKVPVLLDALAQFLFVRRSAHWNALLQAAGGTLTIPGIIEYFGGRGTSKIECISQLIGFFNRLSEEMIDPTAARQRTRDTTLRALLDMYAAYLGLLADQGGVRFCDLSLIQRAATDHLRANPEAGWAFQHVIIDEYQDTNPVQETIFFELARGHKNLCVVGDDDQALYRFRGATVENFVDFPARCERRLGLAPARIVLATNYRSRADIVGFYNRFVVHPSCDWNRQGGGFHRIMDKKIRAHRPGNDVAVVASQPGAPDDVAAEIAGLVRRLLDEKKVADPSQIVFLFPSLKSAHVERMRDALAAQGLEVHAPRAGMFLETPEALVMFGLILQILGGCEHVHTEFRDWLKRACEAGQAATGADPLLARFVEVKRAELRQAAADHAALAAVLASRGWTGDAPYDADGTPAVLAAAAGLSERARRAVVSRRFAHFARERARDGRPFMLGYAVARATSLDASVLDFFYRLTGFAPFLDLFDRAVAPVPDEGPVCNLSLISQYLSRYLDEYPYPISGQNLGSGQFLNTFVNYLYVLFRRGEGEYENVDVPFPKGRVPFMTVHQSKGLEFPVVILANPRKNPRLQAMESVVAPLITRGGEPLDRMPVFDVTRMFYVALSRAKNLIVLAHYRGRGQRLFGPFDEILRRGLPRITDLDVPSLPAAGAETEAQPRSYSYTADFLVYRKCPRQYLLFRKHGFSPSRSQTMFFGSLVHQTIEDLHQRLIFSRQPTHPLP